MRVKHDVDVLDIVLMHQPGKEIEQLTPNNLARLLGVNCSISLPG